MISRIYISFVLFILTFNVSAQEVNIIPRPVSVTLKKNEFLKFDSGISFAPMQDELKKEASLFIDYVFSAYQVKLNVRGYDMDTMTPASKTIRLDLVDKPAGDSSGAYQLKVGPNEGISILAHDRTGIFYGLESLKQLLHHSTDLNLPAVSIKDYPRFEWRGMHLDVCRHFFPVSFVKKYIDLLALHKMNVFHWHLTDDQGWRIEIKKYPKLTETGAWRNGSMVGPYTDHRIDPVRYGGFYTQEEIKEVVKYAAERHITIVPEIEMPGHALAALAAYPELSCTGGPFEVGKEWGVFDDVFCAGNEKTFSFMQDVLDKVCELFPGKYIHVGGDECPKTRWEKCPKCQQRIKNEKLKDEHELQSYFIQRMEKYLNKKDRLIIGWDEILEGGLAPNAAVMSWRGTEGGIAAAKQKHKVVMSPGSHCYFDHYQGNPAFEPHAIGGFTPVEKVYAYEPVPKELGAEDAKYIMGAQANLWTEYINTTDHVEYMALPRMCALAEVLWTPATLKDEKKFLQQLSRHFTYLDRLNVNYSTTLLMPEIKMVRTANGIGASVRPSPLAPTTSVYINAKKGKTNAVLAPDPNMGVSAIVFPIKTSSIFCVSTESTKPKQQEACLDIQVNLATGKSVTFSTPPNEKYSADADVLLVNGLFGTKGHRNGEWVAWSGLDVEITVDLGKKQKIRKAAIHGLNETENWIYVPSALDIFISKDNKNFIHIAKAEFISSPTGTKTMEGYFRKRKTRYIKFVLKNPGKIPEGQPGTGKDSWMFFDEITIH